MTIPDCPTGSANTKLSKIRVGRLPNGPAVRRRGIEPIVFPLEEVRETSVPVGGGSMTIGSHARWPAVCEPPRRKRPAHKIFRPRAKTCKRLLRGGGGMAVFMHPRPEIAGHKTPRTSAPCTLVGRSDLPLSAHTHDGDIE